MWLLMSRAKDDPRLDNNKIHSKAMGIRREASHSQNRRSKWMIEKPNVTPDHTGAQHGHGEYEAEVARLTDVLATGAIGDSTRK